MENLVKLQPYQQIEDNIKISYLALHIHNHNGVGPVTDNEMLWVLWHYMNAVHSNI